MNPTLSKSGIALKNVLFATDFSPTSEVAFAFAASLARRHKATLHLVHALAEAPLLPTTQGYIPAPERYLEEMRYEARSKLEELRQSGRLEDVKTSLVVDEGMPADVLKSIIAAENIDMVVLGTHGRTGVRHLVVGSVAEQVLRHAPCPVLTIGPAVPASAAARPVHTVACAVDLLPGSRKTAAYACALASEYGADLVLMTVDEGDAQRFEYEESMATVKGEMRLAEFQKTLKMECGLQTRLAVGFGPVPEAIFKLLEEHKADLLVMGARPASGFTGLGARLLGGTTHHVLAHAKVPVVTVRG
jgi:nucleotide-binding universal stress UspA family protein